MSNATNQNVTIVAAVPGCELRRSAGGSEKYVLSDMASNISIDLTGERMADSTLQAMVKSLGDNAVTINNEHSSSWDDFDEVTKLWVMPSHELTMEAELTTDHYRSKTLIKGLDNRAPFLAPPRHTSPRYTDRRKGATFAEN
ncbi:MAG TPA: hypothetical protein VGR22_00590 [Thermomicrobiales bacterium]|nr:hypothetical protein [Thermomicrobiales bacterium]